MAYSLYIIGLCMAILVAFIVHIHGKNDSAQNALLIELPEYKTPNGRTVSIYVWDKVKDYLSKAGTTIFIASIVLWFVLNLGPEGFVSDVSHSFAAIIGHVLVPVLRPAGLGAVAGGSGPYFRPLCKGSGCLQFQRPLRNQQCKLRCRYDSAFHSARHGWILEV